MCALSRSRVHRAPALTLSSWVSSSCTVASPSLLSFDWGQSHHDGAFRAPQEAPQGVQLSTCFTPRMEGPVAAIWSENSQSKHL